MKMKKKLFGELMSVKNSSFKKLTRNMWQVLARYWKKKCTKK